MSLTSVKDSKTNRSESKLHFCANGEEEEGGVFPKGQADHQESRMRSFKRNFTYEGCL